MKKRQEMDELEEQVRVLSEQKAAIEASNCHGCTKMLVPESCDQAKPASSKAVRHGSKADPLVRAMRKRSGHLL